MTHPTAQFLQEIFEGRQVRKKCAANLVLLLVFGLILFVGWDAFLLSFGPGGGLTVGVGAGPLANQGPE